MPKGFQRERVAGRIRRELAEILLGFSDASLPSVYITRVELGPAYDYAKVFLAPATPTKKLDEAALVEPLRRVAPALRGQLARRLRLRRTPELDFRLDAGKQNADRIDELLARIAKRSKPLAVLALLFGLAVPSAAAEAKKLERYEASASVMGSTLRLALYGPNKSHLASAAIAAFEEARRIDKLISDYRPDSEWSRINERAASGPVEVSQETIELLTACREYSRLSEGAFDVTIGALVDAWGFFKGSGKLPSPAEVRRARQAVGYELLEIDAPGRRVRFGRRGMRIDPGGIGKGYAVDRVVALVKEYGAVAALVSAGESSIYALGAPPDEPDGWLVSLRDPLDSSKSAVELRLRDESLSTSGSYEKFFELEGKTYTHILDPRTGRPAEGVTAVSVRAASTLDSEAWTTALFVNGVEWTRKHKPANVRAYVCVDGGACSWIGGE